MPVSQNLSKTLYMIIHWISFHCCCNKKKIYFNKWQWWEFFSSPLHPGGLWSPPSLLSNEYQGLIPWEQSCWGVKLINYHHLVPKLRIYGAIPPLPNTHLHGVVL